MWRVLVVGLLIAGGVVQNVPRRPARWTPNTSIRVWIDAGGAPAGSGALVGRAVATWTEAAGNDLLLRPTQSERDALIRVRFARAEGIYGETMPHIDRSTGVITAADVVIASEVGGDAMQQGIVIYLTALHELGHALGLPHTTAFEDIMYSFVRPGDGERYFGRYRRLLRSVDDIGTARASGLSAADAAALHALYGR